MTSPVMSLQHAFKAARPRIWNSSGCVALGRDGPSAQLGAQLAAQLAVMGVGRANASGSANGDFGFAGLASLSSAKWASLKVGVVGR